ncbi:MAG: ATP-binding protein [Patescibacteria group bacterium]|nr:ATP-binding protein [Patescibacteria group bacterium]
MYKRILAEIINNGFKSGFVTMVYGARRVGKTVLLGQIQELLGNGSILSLNGDTAESVNALNTNSEIKLTELVKNSEIIFIDEAQKIPNVSLAVKIIIDKFPDKKIILTGSSSLQLARGSREALTGRNKSFVLYPLSTAELSAGIQDFKIPYLLEDQLIFGGYPYVYALSSRDEKRKYLEEITKDYLFKDVFELERLDRPEIFSKLATLLAFQIGQEVSLNELATSLGVSIKTVSRYLDLLEKSFVVFHLSAFSKNGRKEVVKTKKYYFYDLGIRNSLIGQFLPLSDRTDIGALRENFLIVERMKRQEYSGKSVDMYFWRNYSGAEIDLIEVEDGKLSAYEFKWNKDRAKTPKGFHDQYGENTKLINKDNYLSFIL